jgi:carboxyl-terminal processing protease
MAGSFSGIGAQLKEEDGKIQIVSIIAGSPSWKQGELKANDEILKIGQGADEPVDVQGWDIDDVVSKIRGKKGTEVRLTIRRQDGSQKVIPIIRGDVLMEETFAKSALIQGKNGPIGYITLPEFYADFTTRNGRHCAPDVAIEIEKLKQAGAKSIIFDLRNNGGGSLSDVVDIAGFFIDKGPVVQVKSAQAAPMTLSDDAPGTLFDGPLIVMINNGSASASEIFAAAIQDYHRGLIVGTNSFGKGTVQKLVNLEEVLDPINRMKLSASGEQPMGALKLTMQKFYRVNGGSTQLRGVAPDIVLPDAYELLDEIGERKDKSALQWDQIAPLPISAANSLNGIPTLAARSKSRLASNEAFRIIEASAQKMKAREDGKAQPLNEKAYRQEVTEANALNKRLEAIEKAGTPISVASLKADDAQVNRDSTTVKKNQDWLKNLKKDVYLSETVQIMNDLAGTALTGSR